MLYFWVALFTLMISILNYSVHMDASLYMQKQKKIADEQAILEDVLTSSEYIGKIIAEDKAKCSDFNKCTELLRKRLEENGHKVDNDVMHCRDKDKIITYYNYKNNKFYDSVLSLYKKYGVQDLKTITIDHATSLGCQISSEGVYIQKEYKNN